MARRVSWTNNSSGHSGTYVYRAPSPMDTQNLPAPLATVGPVAQGATADWNDQEVVADGDYDYAVQDYDQSGVSALSSIATFTASTIQHAGDGDWASTTSGTQITTSVPTNIQEGDFLVCGIMHRETLTPPSGWTAAVTAGPTTGDFPQWTAFFTRTATSADAGASYDWAQANNNRMQAQISAFRYASPLAVIDTFSSVGVPDSETNQFPLADATSTSNNQIVISGNSTEIHSGSGGANAESSIIPDADWTQITPITNALPEGDARRLCVGWLTTDGADVYGGFMERDPGGETLAPDQSPYAAAAIVIGKA